MRLLKFLLHRVFGGIEDRDLVSSRELQRCIRREQARTDRNGDPFCLLVLSPPTGPDAARSIRAAASIVCRRIRITDEAGWLDRRTIGIVLPSTSPHGAWTLADDICLAMPLHLELPVCRVYVYPPPRSSAGSETNSEIRAEGGSPVGSMDAFSVVALPWWKRVLDVALASIAIVAVLPIFAATALAIKLSSPGPVLFRQRRAGLGGKTFICYKFRTMVADAELLKGELMARNEQDGPAFKIRNDPRVTPLGRFLRQTSIDELPQLWNVIRGEMSLVGPRPLPVAEAEACRGWLRRRQEITPGLTCIWQVHGRSQVSFVEWVRMDLRYARTFNLWEDLKLILQTVPVMLIRRNGC